MWREMMGSHFLSHLACAYVIRNVDLLKYAKRKQGDYL